MTREYGRSLKMHIFHEHFLNMDISFIMALRWMTFSIHVYETYYEGSVSQNFDIYLSFYFIVCRILFAEFLKKMRGDLIFI